MDFSGQVDPVKRRYLVETMTATLRHRGPDAEGFWEDRDAGVMFGHRRLSVIDLSTAGSQPMISFCGRYVLVYNGEIYNHMSLRTELEAGGMVPAWRGDSDTETLLAAIARWGLTGALRRSCGMFALALWDRATRSVSLARDRMGEKPLYLVRLGQNGAETTAARWAFSSELRGLSTLPGISRKVNSDAVAALLTYGYVTDHQCIYQDVRKVSPGHILTIDNPWDEPTENPFETFPDLLAEGKAGCDNGGDEQVRLDALERVLMGVVDEQMLSDVSLGCFLSGGIDSSLVASLMQAQSDRPIRTFSIGFDVHRFNEAPNAAAVARHLGTDHTEFLLTEDEALAEIPTLAKTYDEPFADPSQIPTSLLCREARRSVTVALTGDGGDEVFGGYNRHFMAPRLLKYIEIVPQVARRPIARGLSMLTPTLAKQDSWLRSVASMLGLPNTAIDRAVGIAPVLADIEDLEDLYNYFSKISINCSGLLEDPVVKVPKNPFPNLPDTLNSAEWMMAVDTLTYLPSDILVKLDRASMASSLETRAPFLDRRTVTAAWALPQSMKTSSGIGKIALRRLLSRHVPPRLFERPKQGFAIPLDAWLRGALKNWAEDLMREPEQIKHLGLNPYAVSQMWLHHQNGQANRGRELWSVLMLLHWSKNADIFG